MATTSKEGSRRVNYSVPIRRGSDDKYQCQTPGNRDGNWNEHNLNKCASNNWRASLVPAAAVIQLQECILKLLRLKRS